jgi:hypothetical protein
MTSPTIDNSRKFLAQIFSVSTPNGISGIYATKIGLYFKEKSNYSTVTLSIVEINNGFPDPTLVVPNSSVVVSSDNIQISDNAAAETPFSFSVPVFLTAGRQYAFVVSTPFSDFELWTGAQGERDVRTNELVSSNPLTEKAYFSENSNSWSELLNKDITFKLYRARFNTTQAAKINFIPREKYDYLIIKDIVLPTTLSFLPSDEIYKLNPADNVTILPAGTANAAVGTIESYDEETNLLVVKMKEGNFAKGDFFKVIRPSTSGSIVNATLLMKASVRDFGSYAYHGVLPRLAIDERTTSNITLKMRGTTLSANGVYNKETNNFDIYRTQETEFSDRTRYIRSRSANTAAPFVIEASLTAQNDYIAPFVWADTSSVLLSTNLINNNTSAEESRDGFAASKYVSRVITLADGQEAEDLRVFIDAYKTARTNVVLYAKMQSAEDSSNFDDLLWTELEQVTPETLLSDPNNPNDYREYEFTIPEANKNDGVFEYATENGTFDRIKKYRLKVVFTAEPGFEFNVPKIANIRAIALQK